MDEKFDSDVFKLEREINDITANINKFKNKNHRAMINMMEKIKLYSNKNRTKYDLIDMTKQTLNDSSKRSFQKIYQNLSNASNSSPTNNGIYQYENKNFKKTPIILKCKEKFNNNNTHNIIDNDANFFYLNNYEQNKKINLLSNIYHNSACKNSISSLYNNRNIYRKNNNRNNAIRSNKTKCFSFNFNNFSSYDCSNYDNENDIRRRNFSLNNFEINNIIFKKDLTNDCSSEDLKCSKKIINKKGKIKRVTNIKCNKKIQEKKVGTNIPCVIRRKNECSKELNNIKREQCSINISDFYKNINNSQNKELKAKIPNNKNIKNQMNTVSNSSKYENNNSRNYYSRTYSNFSNKKDCSRGIYTSFNAYNSKNNDENEKNPNEGDKPRQILRKSANSFRAKIPVDNNIYSNKNMNNFHQYNKYKYHNYTEKNNDLEYNYNYNYCGFNNRRNKSYEVSNIDNINSDINLNVSGIKKNYNFDENNIKSKNGKYDIYNKDFIDIITNKKSDKNKIENLSTYTNTNKEKKIMNKYGLYMDYDRKDLDMFDNKFESKYNIIYDSKYNSKYNSKYDSKYDKKYDNKYDKKYDNKYDNKYDKKYDNKYDKIYDNKYDYLSVNNKIINDKKEEKKNEIKNNNNINSNFNEYKYNILYSKLKCNNIDECLNKVDNLLNYTEFINKINSLYDKNNIKKEEEKNQNNLNNIFSWVKTKIEENKKYKEDFNKYQSFCMKIKDEFKIDGYDKLKNFLFKTLNSNNNNKKKDESFVLGLRKIMSESNLDNLKNIKVNKSDERLNMNLHFFYSDDYTNLKNKTHSYSNLSINDMKNGDENMNIINNNNILLNNNMNNKSIVLKKENNLQ